MAGKGNRKTGGTRTEGLDFDFTRSPIHLLRRAQQRALEVFNKEVGASGLTPRQFVVLLAVQENEGLTQTDLVNRTRIDRSTLADMISRLIKRDLLSRSRTERDQRANAVTITTAGRRALRTALGRIQRAEERLLGNIPENRRNSFLESLGALAGPNAEEQSESTPRAGRRRASAALAQGGATQQPTRAGSRSAAKDEQTSQQGQSSASGRTGRGRGKSAATLNGGGNGTGAASDAAATDSSNRAVAMEGTAEAAPRTRGRGRAQAASARQNGAGTTSSAEEPSPSGSRGRGRPRAGAAQQRGAGAAAVPTESAAPTPRGRGRRSVQPAAAETDQPAVHGRGEQDKPGRSKDRAGNRAKAGSGKRGRK